MPAVCTSQTPTTWNRTTVEIVRGLSHAKKPYHNVARQSPLIFFDLSFSNLVQESSVDLWDNLNKVRGLPHNALHFPSRGVIGRNIALWQNLWVGVGWFERRSSSALTSLALCGRLNQFRSPYSWITMRRALRKRRVFGFVPSYLKLMFTCSLPVPLALTRDVLTTVGTAVCSDKRCSKSSLQYLSEAGPCGVIMKQKCHACQKKCWTSPVLFFSFSFFFLFRWTCFKRSCLACEGIPEETILWDQVYREGSWALRSQSLPVRSIRTFPLCVMAITVVEKTSPNHGSTKSLAWMLHTHRGRLSGAPFCFYADQPSRDPA